MASLRNIMNVEDDHPDSGSLKKDNDSRPSPSQHHLDSTTHITGYQPPSDLLTTLPPSQLQRGTSSSHALPSLTPEQYPSSASPGFSSSGSTSRRRSNTSTESMDAPYIQGYAHMGSSTGVPMRPSMSGPSGPEVPLKLTPVTRKVSRARKGMPVHVCDQCRPPKTFTRAEHLRRHRLSHQPPDRACPVPGCDKVFHRQDLLERHQQRHEQDEKAPRSTNTPPSTRPYQPDGPTTPFYSPAGAGRASQPSTQNDPDIATSTGLWPDNINLGASAGHQISPQSNFPASSDGNNYGLGPVHSFGIPQNLDIGFITRVTPDLPSRPTHLVISDDMLGYHDGPRIPSSASSTYSTPSDEPSRPPGNWRAQNSPYPSVPKDIHSPLMEANTYPVPAFHYSAEEDFYYPKSMELAIPGFEESPWHGSPQISIPLVRSLSPQLAAVQTSETLVPTSSALPTGRLIIPRACGPQQGEACDLLAAKDLMPVFLSAALRNAIPAYLDVYWSKVHPVYPIIHRATFADLSEIAPEHADVLRCAMASIATQFCDGKDDRIRGDQLHTYAWQKSKVFTQPDEWPLPIMQAVLLCEYYARFRGRKKTSHQPSARFEMLFQKVLHEQRLHSLYRRTTGGPQQWRLWSRSEALNRLLAACFILDVHTMCYYEQSSCSPMSVLDYTSPQTLAVPLSASTATLWDAEDTQTWQHLSKSRICIENVSTAFDQGLTPQKIAAAPAFDASILLAAHALELPGLRKFTAANQKHELSSSWTSDLPFTTLFADSACANTYMALQHTPLRALLSVSGDSWVFNKKVLDKSLFTKQQQQLTEWRGSNTSYKAVVYAAKALKGFLRLPANTGVGITASQTESVTKPKWQDISDYWGFYVCTLICWAYSHHVAAPPTAQQSVTLQWLQATASLQFAQQEASIDLEAARGVVGLARTVLTGDSRGGRNILLADAVGVLTKLQGGSDRRF